MGRYILTSVLALFTVVLFISSFGFWKQKKYAIAVAAAIIGIFYSGLAFTVWEHF